MAVSAVQSGAVAYVSGYPTKLWGNPWHTIARDENLQNIYFCS